jgi:hypothetical protein
MSIHAVHDPSQYATTSGGLRPEGATKSSSRSLPHVPDLAVTIDASRELPLAVEGGILAMISAASGKGLPRA